MLSGRNTTFDNISCQRAADSMQDMEQAKGLGREAPKKERHSKSDCSYSKKARCNHA